MRIINGLKLTRTSFPMNKRFLGLFVLLSTTTMPLGCKQRSYNANNNSQLSISTTSCLAQEADRSFPLITSPEKTTLTYHWTFDDSAETTAGAIRMVKSRLAKIASEPITDHRDAFGPGLYVASDPVTSRGYGDILLIVPVRPQCEFGMSQEEDAGSDKSKSLAKSALVGIVYPFGSEGSRALVIRSTSAIDVEKIESISLRHNKNLSIAEIPLFPLNGKVKWTDALRHYGVRFPLWLMSPAESKNWKTLLSKTRSDDGEITELGLVLVKLLEFTFPTEKKVELLKSALTATTGKDFFPWCYEKTTSDKIPSASSVQSIIYGGCYITGIVNTFSEIFPDFIVKNANKKMSVSETNHTLITAGLLPENWNTNTPLEESRKEAMHRIFFDNAFVQAAVHFYKVLDAIDTEDFSTQNSLDGWKE